MIKAISILFAYLVSFPTSSQEVPFRLVDSASTECDHIHAFMSTLYFSGYETDQVVGELQRRTAKSEGGIVYLGGSIFKMTENTITVRYHTIGPDDLVVMTTVLPIRSKIFLNKMYIGNFDKELVRDRKRFKKELERRGWNREGLFMENLIKREYVIKSEGVTDVIKYPGRFIFEFNGNYYLSIVGGGREEYLVLYLMDSGLTPEEESSCVFAY